MLLNNQLTALLSFLSLLLAANSFVSKAQAAEEDERTLQADFTRENDASLFWGPYRPNLYFGIRPRIPNSLMTGLLWAKVDSYVDVQNNFRYTCEQNEGMAGYGWEQYDARKGGVQTIHDAGNMIDITTEFVKSPGGRHGGGWAARIKGKPREGAPEDLKTTLVFYATTDHLGDLLEVSREEGDEGGFDGDILLKGHSDALGWYKLVITKGKGEHPKSDHPIDRDLDKTIVFSQALPEEYLWQAKAILFQGLKASVDSIMEDYGAENAPPPWQVYRLQHKPETGNVQLIQKTFEGPFEFDILFTSDSSGKIVTRAEMTRRSKDVGARFDKRFMEVFAPQAPFEDEKYLKFGKSMFSNLAGGIGYFHGHQVVDRSNAPEYEEEDEGFWEETEAARARHEEKLEGPYELFSSVPSRPFFPRGFLWDEGFHLLPISDWDIDLTLTIVKSWFNLMDEDGWIAREVILGPEARSKVPEAFQVQYPHYANPPTLFLVIENFLQKLQRSNGTKIPWTEGLLPTQVHLEYPELGLDYLRELYPLLRRQFEWFKETQYGDIKSYDREAYSTREAYRWRGRTVQHILTSGIDDYPRPQPPHPGELHVDLMSWVGMMTKSLLTIAKATDQTDDVAEYTKVLDGIEHNLVDLHWSEENSCFCDATIDAFEENQLVCHKGYVSLFPFLTGLLKPNDPHLGKLLDLIGDEEELWSDHGIRSLSRKSEFYGTDENYWRSPVWININYMAVVQLYNIATQKGPYAAKATDLYSRLRRNIVDTVYSSWEETGFAWEQYNPETGKGQRTQHFTGWTSLVVKIMAMPDLKPGDAGHVRDEL